MEAEGKRNEIQFLLEAIKTCDVSSGFLSSFLDLLNFNISIHSTIPRVRFTNKNSCTTWFKTKNCTSFNTKDLHFGIQ
jgi:hypothetical protein